GRPARRCPPAAAAIRRRAVGGGQGSACRARRSAVYNPAAMNDSKTSAAADAAAGDSDSADADRRHLLVVTGLSGAGRTTALKILEDFGYEAVDNLPLMFLSGLAGDIAGAERALAVGIDSRTRDFTAFALSDRLDRLKAEA